MTAENIHLCALTELAANPARGMTIKSGASELQVFIVRHNDRLYGYINRCPHTGVNLDWLPDQFLDATGRLMMCATHGAQFRIEDGYCIQGPCSGRSLTPIAISIKDSMVVLHPNQPRTA